MKDKLREYLSGKIHHGGLAPLGVEQLAAALEAIETADYYAARRKAIEDEPMYAQWKRLMDRGDALSDAAHREWQRHGRLDDGPRPSYGPNPCGEIPLDDKGPGMSC